MPTRTRAVAPRARAQNYRMFAWAAWLRATLDARELSLRDEHKNQLDAYAEGARAQIAALRKAQREGSLKSTARAV